jgi:magnesium transporter
MTPEATSLTEDYTVEQAIDELRRLSQEAETLYYVYVVDAGGHLIGVLSMRDLILAHPQRHLSDILIKDVRSVNARLDREEVARLMSRYDYLALPVVDDENRLLGIITVDDVIDVIHEEATEDIQRMVGASGDERVDSPWLYSLRKRLPWLEVNLGTAFLAAAVVGVFEGIIARITALAVFLPVVAGQGGNTGAQALAVVIRALALGEVSGRAAWRVIRRELLLGLASGIVVGLTTSAVAYLWVRSPMIGVVIGSAMVVNMTLATVAGAAIPLGLRALRLDPAQSSSIILTTVTDVVGFGAFLGLATLLLK